MTLLTTSRLAAYEKQGGSCYYCALPMWLDDDAEALGDYLGVKPRPLALLQCTAEHVLARCEGGSDAKSNIVAACLFCNMRRHQHRHAHAPDVESYRVHVSKRMAKGRWHPILPMLKYWGAKSRSAPQSSSFLRNAVHSEYPVLGSPLLPDMTPVRVMAMQSLRIWA